MKLQRIMIYKRTKKVIFRNVIWCCESYNEFLTVSEILQVTIHYRK